MILRLCWVLSMCFCVLVWGILCVSFLMLDCMAHRYATMRAGPSIHASSYMILRAPGHYEFVDSAKAQAAAAKLAANSQLWELARRAMLAVDAAYADLYTAVAFTKSFVGSPHIGKQNTGPFYGGGHAQAVGQD